MVDLGEGLLVGLKSGV